VTDRAGDGEGARSLGRNPELEAALREAEQAVERREAGAGSDSPPDRESAGSSAQEEVENLASELVQARDQLLRLQADFDNFRKRALKERNEVLQYGHQNLVKELLSVVDNLERAIGHARTSGGGDLAGLLQGVELVQRELLGALEKHGVDRVEARGQLFDPAVHEAMAQVADASAAPGTVLEVLQEGYRLRDRLLRPARVVVARPPEGPEGRG
jgi:molecular chaperone GrpE